MAKINARRHRETARVPSEALAEERARLHVLPAAPHTMALGRTRIVNTDQTIRFGSVRYSTPARTRGIRSVGAGGWLRAGGRGRSRRPAGGPGVGRRPTGTHRGRPPPAGDPGQSEDRVGPLSQPPAGPRRGNPAATAGRFAEDDLAAIVDHQATGASPQSSSPPRPIPRSLAPAPGPASPRPARNSPRELNHHNLHCLGGEAVPAIARGTHRGPQAGAAAPPAGRGSGRAGHRHSPAVGPHRGAARAVSRGDPRPGRGPQGRPP